jgi:hypothetical protein
MKIRKLVYSVAAIALAVSAMALVTPAQAQGSGDTGSTTATTTGVGLGLNFWVVEACSTTDYAAVVSDALGITATELRKALAGGQSISDLADEKSVELSAVTDAVSTARSADVDAALAAGLLTEDEAQALKDLLSNGTLTIMPGLGRGPQIRLGQPSDDDQSDEDQSSDDSQLDERPLRLQIHMPDGMEELMLGFGRGGMFGLGGWGLGQQVKPYQVAATALNVSCADLVKAAVDGQSIAEVAAQTEGGVQTVTDALVAAHEAAIDTALSEGLISEVQADSAKTDVLNSVLMQISRPAAGRGMGLGMLGGELGGMMDQLRERFGMGGMMGGRVQRGR